MGVSVGRVKIEGGKKGERDRKTEGGRQRDAVQTRDGGGRRQDSGRDCTSRDRRKPSLGLHGLIHNMGEISSYSVPVRGTEPNHTMLMPREVS